MTDAVELYSPISLKSCHIKHQQEKKHIHHFHSKMSHLYIAHKLSKSNCFAWHWPIWSRYIGNFKWSASTLTNMKLQPQSHMVLVKPCRLDIKVYSWRGWTAQLVVQKIQLSVKHIKICKGGIKPAANNLKFWMRQNHKKMMFYWLYVNVKTVCRHKRTHSTRHAVSLHPEE